MVAGRPLENAPECGIPRPGSNNQQPWLGALFVVPLDSPEKADKFIVPVAIISARTRLDPDRPTIIVASGEMFGDKVFNTWSSSVSSEDLASLVRALHFYLFESIFEIRNRDNTHTNRE